MRPFTPSVTKPQNPQATKPSNSKKAQSKGRSSRTGTPRNNATAWPHISAARITPTRVNSGRASVFHAVPIYTVVLCAQAHFFYRISSSFGILRAKIKILLKITQISWYLWGIKCCFLLVFVVICRKMLLFVDYCLIRWIKN